MTCAATTVEAAASTMEAVATATMEAISAVELIASPHSTTVPFVTLESAMAPITAPIIPTAIVTTAIVAVSIETMEPGAGAYEYSVREVVRAPISVGRASVRSIRIVAVGAHRRRPNRYAHRTYSDSHSYLRARHRAHREH